MNRASRIAVAVFVYVMFVALAVLLGSWAMRRGPVQWWLVFLVVFGVGWWFARRMRAWIAAT